MKFKALLLLLISIISLCCNKTYFVNKSRVVQKVTGLMIFFEYNSSLIKSLNNGDVFTDSLIKDIFIPYKFNSRIIERVDVENAIFSKNMHSGSFIHLIRDCNGEDRKSAITYDCMSLMLNNKVDNYTTNRIYVQPVEIEFVETNLSPEYYLIYKKQELSFKNSTTILSFRKGAYEVLRINVLEHNW